MSGGSPFAGVAEILAMLLKPVAAAVFLWTPPVLRLWRLASTRSQTVGRVPVSTQFDGPVRVVGTGKLGLGESCRLGRDVLFETSGVGEITLGQRVRINAGSVVVAICRVSIGDDTLIGEYVSIRDANHGVSAGRLIRSQEHVAGEIQIGRDVWIGRGSCILKGVTIGDGAVIGANSVITRDVPENAIFAGVPAKQIGVRVSGKVAPGLDGVEGF